MDFYLKITKLPVSTLFKENCLISCFSFPQLKHNSNYEKTEKETEYRLRKREEEAMWIKGKEPLIFNFSMKIFCWKLYFLAIFLHFTFTFCLMWNALSFRNSFEPCLYNVSWVKRQYVDHCKNAFIVYYTLLLTALHCTCKVLQTHFIFSLYIILCTFLPKMCLLKGEKHQKWGIKHVFVLSPDLLVRNQKNFRFLLLRYINAQKKTCISEQSFGAALSVFISLI